MKTRKASVVAILIAFTMIFACFTTACQPTPEKVVVQNKADDDLKNAIEQTAAPTEQITQQVQPTETAKPKIMIQDVSSNASNTVTVDIDAEVINDQPGKIPVVKIAPSSYTQDEWLHMIEVFFGNTELYTRDPIKEDYDYFILQKQYQMNDPEQLQEFADARDITDLSVAKKNIQAAIDRAIDSRSNAPEEREKTDLETAINSERGLDMLIKTREGFLGNVKNGIMTAFNDDNNYFMHRRMQHFEYIDSKYDNQEFLDAKQMAVKMIADMDIDNVEFGDAFISKDYFSTDSGSYWNGREYYVFCFDTVVGDSVIDNTRTWVTPPALVDMSGKDGYEDVPEPQYDQVIPYDRLEVWVEGDKIVQFKHRYPLEITQIINDNVAIAIDYPEAIELAKQFAYTAFIDPRGNSIESKLDIYKIELVLVRIKEKDTGDDIVVPVWNFCGAWLQKVNPDNKISISFADENGWLTTQGIERASDVLITINALDGTNVDLMHGY